MYGASPLISPASCSAPGVFWRGECFHSLKGVHLIEQIQKHPRHHLNHHCRQSCASSSSSSCRCARPFRPLSTSVHGHSRKSKELFPPLIIGIRHAAHSLATAPGRSMRSTAAAVHCMRSEIEGTHAKSRGEFTHR